MESAGLQETPLALDHKQHPSPPLNVMSSDFDTPARGPVTDHGVPSNLRNADEQNPFDQPFLPHSDLTKTTSYDDAAAYDSFPDFREPSTPMPNGLEHEDVQSALDQVLDTSQPGPTNDEQQQDQGYAMLSFADSYHVLKARNLMVGRDQGFLERWKDEKKERKRMAKFERRNQIQEQHTQRALNDYAKEPSQPSQTGDDVALYPSSASADDDGLDGRPARGLLSHYSEQGGPVSYTPHSDEEKEHRWRRERARVKPTSSSATSIAPRDLHQFETITMSAREGEAYTGPEASENPEDWAQLPVHTTNPEDIKRISREHLLFHYDSDNRRWVVDVVGNKAYVGNELYTKGTRNIPLENGTEIFISTVQIVFRLPIQVGDVESDVSEDEDDDDSDDEVDATSDRRLSNNAEVEDEDEDAEEPETRVQKPIKLKLKVAKAPAKEPASGKGKGPGKSKPKAASKSKPVEPSTEDNAESAKPVEKGKRPAEDSTAAKATPTGDETAEGVKTEQNGNARPINILPGSILENLAPDQLPEKRKGPGRPPKNGLLSKRDERAVTRRRKEYERRNMPVPDFNVILAEVREEQKAKDAAAKGNKLRPEGATDAIESIEAADQPEDGVAGQTQPRDPQASQSADAGPAGSSGLPRRPLRSPSPMKPQEAFTEEELKKPTLSYFYLLDEILQATGSADLQTIYDKFQKRWPYFRYTVTTTGWQSSIRHNLSQHSRFKAVGKMGKGMLWAVDFDAPREETGTKKKKSPPPQRPPQMPMGNGQMPPGMPQYPPQYPPRYGHQQAPYNPGQGQGQYSSPYGAHPGQYPPHGPSGPHPHHQNGQPMNGSHMGPPAQGQHMQQPSNSAQPNQQPAQPANPVVAITQDIMSFRNVYLARLPGQTLEFEAESARFFNAVNYFSEIFHGSGGGDKPPHPGDEALKSEPYVTLKAIFDRHDTSARNAGSNGAAQGQGQPGIATAGENGAPAAQPNGQGMPAEQAQPPQQPQAQQPTQPPAQQQAQPPVHQPNGHSSAPPMAAPPSNGTAKIGQNVQQSVASQTAAAVAQAANGSHGSTMPASNALDTNANVHGGAQQPPVAVAAAPTPAPAPTQPEEQPVNEAPAGQDQQPAITAAVELAPAPAPAAVPPQVPDAAPPEQNANEPAKQSPPAEQARPTSAGVKRGAEDVEMPDAESEAKRQRTE